MVLKQICGKCYSDSFVLRSVTKVAASFEIEMSDTEEDSIIPIIGEAISEPEIAYEQFTCICGEAYETVEQLTTGGRSDVSNKFFPTDMLVTWDSENETYIGTQEEYDALHAPSIEQMNEEQLRSHALNQESTIATMQEQLAMLMAQMQQLTANGAPTQQPIQQPTQAPVQQPVQQPAQVPSQAPTQVPVQQMITIIDDESEDDDDDIFNNASPFGDDDIF